MTATQQRSCEVWASNLLYLTFGVSVVADFLLNRGYFAPHKTTGQYLMLYGANPLLLFVYYKIREGLKGAKTFFLTLYAFVLLQLLNGGQPPASYDTPLELASLLVQHGLQIGACLLMLFSLLVPTRTPAKAN
jgi:hypothetical protein